MSEMVGTVARALAPHVTGQIIDALPKDRADLKAQFRVGTVLDINQTTQADMIDIARAAIEAMREPTEEMKTAGADELFASVDEDWGEDAKRIYQAMIDATLSDSGHAE